MKRNTKRCKLKVPPKEFNAIIRVIAKYYGVKPKQITGYAAGRQRGWLLQARHVSCYIVLEMYPLVTQRLMAQRFHCTRESLAWRAKRVRDNAYNYSDDIIKVRKLIKDMMSEIKKEPPVT